VPLRASILDEPTACTLAAGDLEATFLPAHGMLGASLKLRGVELLRRVDDLDHAAVAGGTAGIPFLHPWANRLSGFEYRAAGRKVALDRRSSWMRFDVNGLPIHGVPWSMLAWQVMERSRELLIARLEWTRGELYALYPFPHRVDLAVCLSETSLTLETTLTASGDEKVPVSFGFHPYFGLPDLPRTKWRLRLPAMRQLMLDERRIPTGSIIPFTGFDAPLGTRDFDDGFVLDRDNASLSISDGGRSVAVEFVDGFRYAQVYAPTGRDLIALEPMTAPTNALTSGDALPLVESGQSFRAVFRIRVDG
jgi:aldose 1-epimerase